MHQIPITPFVRMDCIIDVFSLRLDLLMSNGIMQSLIDILAKDRCKVVGIRGLTDYPQCLTNMAQQKGIRLVAGNVYSLITNNYCTDMEILVARHMPRKIWCIAKHDTKDKDVPLNYCRIASIYGCDMEILRY